MREHRTVTVHTIDFGPVTVPEPAWCLGEHVDGTVRGDIEHAGAETVMEFRGRHILGFELLAYPFAERMPRGPLMSVELDEAMSFYDPAALLELADALTVHARRLRGAAAVLAAVLDAAGGEGR
ncbi:DUF6907 domain-containing protein [Streptomyces sp. YIM 98790]|uniref:DUF6907 domain-containing protein n=1 Tax=Streptomyces sp. YIM 98790 TaxID=2689077 RepID=UPI00140E155B|nr:hypothetical protein [Streptomyces sp. YIM 98790]